MGRRVYSKTVMFYMFLIFMNSREAVKANEGDDITKMQFAHESK